MHFEVSPPSQVRQDEARFSRVMQLSSGSRRGYGTALKKFYLLIYFASFPTE